VWTSGAMAFPDAAHFRSDVHGRLSEAIALERESKVARIYTAQFLQEYDALNLLYCDSISTVRKVYFWLMNYCAWCTCRFFQ
jgi:hypothetical protein